MVRPGGPTGDEFAARALILGPAGGEDRQEGGDKAVFVALEDGLCDVGFVKTLGEAEKARCLGPVGGRGKGLAVAVDLRGEAGQALICDMDGAVLEQGGLGLGQIVQDLGL